MEVGGEDEGKRLAPLPYGFRSRLDFGVIMARVGGLQITGEFNEFNRFSGVTSKGLYTTGVLTTYMEPTNFDSLHVSDCVSITGGYGRYCNDCSRGLTDVAGRV